MILGTFIKQPSDTMDYDIDYTDWLTTGDNVSSVVITKDTGITVDSSFINDPRVKIWLSGGTAGTTYKVTCTMTSADGRIRQDEFKVKVREF
jgi:hypothetical protein